MDARDADALVNAACSLRRTADYLRSIHGLTGNAHNIERDALIIENVADRAHPPVRLKVL